MDPEKKKKARILALYIAQGCNALFTLTCFACVCTLLLVSIQYGVTIEAAGCWILLWFTMDRLNEGFYGWCHEEIMRIYDV